MACQKYAQYVVNVVVMAWWPRVSAENPGGLLTQYY